MRANMAKNLYTKANWNNKYSDKSTILFEIASSITAYKEYQMLYIGRDVSRQAHSLRTSGTKAFIAMELAYKYCLYRKYKEAFMGRVMQQSTYDSKLSYLSSRKCNHYYLQQEFLLYENTDIDLEMILRSAKSCNNLIKHEDGIPDPHELRLALNEISRFIKKFIEPSFSMPTFENSVSGISNAWTEFFRDVDSFGDSNTYILIAPENIGDPNHELKNLFNINWDMVIDFCPSSDTNGLECLYENTTKIRAHIRDFSALSCSQTIHLSQATYWVMANGFIDQSNTITQTPLAWINRYSNNALGFFKKFRSIYPKRAKVIIMQGVNAQILTQIVTALTSAYLYIDANTQAERYEIEFFLLSGDDQYLQINENISVNFNRTLLKLNELLEHLNIRNHYSSHNQIKRAIPGNEYPIELDEDFYVKFSEFGDLVHLNIENTPKVISDPKQFYIGAKPISWIGLRQQIDVLRYSYTHVYKEKISENMQKRTRVLFVFDYTAGFGGTTLLRRIAWDFHNAYPVVILHDYNHNRREYFVGLYELCKLPLLILVDSNELPLSTVQKLKDDLDRESFGHVIIYFNRNEHVNRTEVKNRFATIGNLKKQETDELCDILLPIAQDDVCRKNLRKICQLPLDSEDRCPFIMALTAFDKEFLGIKAYITNFLTTLTDQEKKIIVYIALADYANAQISCHFLDYMFGSADVRQEFTSQIGAFKMLVSNVSSGPKNSIYKMKHYRFTEEVLIQVSNGRDGTRITFDNLDMYLLMLIKDSRPNQCTVSRFNIEFLRTLFITRVEDDEAKPNFSPIIETIREEETKLGIISENGILRIGRIFRELVSVYPDEPHFVAHLARYQYYMEGNYIKGDENIVKAITISELQTGKKDPMLYHMKAMGIVSLITNELIPCLKKMKSDEVQQAEIDEKISVLQEATLKAQEIFQLVRDISTGIPGYVSEIHLCLSIISFGRYITNSVDNISFLENNTDSWYISIVDNACHLYDECIGSRGDEEDQRLQELKADILMLKEDVVSAINAWQSYLEQASAREKPRIRRMLARAYRDYDNTRNDQESIRYVAELMERNILEEPNNASNYRLWFGSVRKLKVLSPETLLADALIKLNKWVMETDTPEAWYYRFVLTYIQAIEGSVRAQGVLPKLVKELRERTDHLEGRTIIRDWLGKEGSGIERLIMSSDIDPSCEAETLNKLKIIEGRVSERYINQSHAYITVAGVDVFFNPSATKGNINISNIRSRVGFAIGFSFEGPRAYNNSVSLLSTGKHNKEDKLEELSGGMIVSCEVKNNRGSSFIDVKILGYEIDGSIHINDMLECYKIEQSRPAVGTVINALTMHKRYVEGRGEIWALAMRS